MSIPEDKYEQMERAFLLYSQNRAIPDQVPSGWFTASEFSKKIKKSEREAQRFIRDLLSNDLAETKVFKIKTGLRIYPVHHYKLKTNGKAKKKTSQGHVQR